MHPDRAIAHSRAVEDAYKGVKDNRYSYNSLAWRAYEAKHSEFLRKMEALPGCKGTDQDVHNDSRPNNQSV